MRVVLIYPDDAILVRTNDRNASFRKKKISLGHAYGVDIFSEHN